MAMANRTFQLAALDHLFAPRAVALIGASATPGKWGLFVLHNLLKDGYAGRVHAVGRKGASAFGQTFYGSLDEIEGDIDLALVCVPPAGVLGAVVEVHRSGTHPRSGGDGVPDRWAAPIRHLGIRRGTGPSPHAALAARWATCSN